MKYFTLCAGDYFITPGNRMSEDALQVEQTFPDTNTVTTSVQLHVSKEAVVAQLHALEDLITLNPLVTSFEQLSSDPNDDPRSCCYKIVDTLQVWGMTFLQTYTAKLIPLDDGVSVLTNAGLGVSTTGRWVVEKSETKGVTVSETSKVKCSSILRGYVISRIKSSHLVLIRELCKKIDSE